MLPVAARCTPPDTGQSTASAPRSSTNAASRPISATSVVDISNQAFPGPIPARMPSAVSITAADAAGEGRQVMMTSQASAMAFGLSPKDAPPARNGSAALRSRSRTTRSMQLRSSVPASLPPA
jgi:hypothetical protein